MNNDDKKEKSEEIFFNNLFENKEKEVNEQLYKNEFYVLEEEMKTNKEQNSLQFMHDTLLNKLMLEDYSPFPPKNEEPTIVNNQKDEKKKEDEQDKLIEEENEFLRSLHRINYLTFSPFGLSFFDDISKDSPSLNEEYYKEREEKILNMIDFDYNNFDVTNDLLLNICQGFVDINKLKEENLTKNKEKEKAKEKQKELANNLIPKEEDAKQNETPKIEKQVLDKYEQEFVDEITAKLNIPFYKEFLTPCKEEFDEAKDKFERKIVIANWKQKIKEKDNDYDLYLKELEEKKRKEMEEERRLKEIQRKKQKELEEEQKNNERLMKAFEDIIHRAKKDKVSKSQNKVNNQKKQIKPRNKSTNKSIDKTPKKEVQVSKSPYGISRGNKFNIASNYFNKNYSKSQAKIKTIPNTNLK